MFAAWRPLLALCVASVVVAHACAFAIWPQPQSIKTGSDTAVVDPGLGFSANVSSDVLSAAFVRYKDIIFPVAADETQSEVESRRLGNAKISKVVVHVANGDDTLQFGVDESYVLKISADDDTVRIMANTPYGALRGIETFSQVVSYDSSSGVYSVSALPVQIDDFPRFPWRGILVDTARHYLPIQTLKHIVDALAYEKLNVLHWHAIDAQSFPLVSAKYPLLSEKGAWAPKAVFSQAEIRDLVAYAKLRGVRVVLEMDTPGHAFAWGLGYPDLTAKCPLYEKNINNIPLNPAKNETYDFLSALLSELLPNFEDEYFHMGGDELVYGCWEQDPDVSAFMSAHGMSDADMFRYYHDHLLDILASIRHPAKSRGLVWEEVFEAGIMSDTEDTLVHVWKDKTALLKAVKAGRHAILSAGWYLDRQLPSAPHYEWEDTWMDFYVNDPIDSDFTPEEAARVEGGEAAMWGEQVDQANFDSRVWPRACAISERLWSAESVNVVDDALPRLVEHRCRLVNRHIGAGPIAPDFCERLVD